MTPVERADRARAILEDPIFQESVAKLREFYRDKIEETSISEPDVLLEIRQMLFLLKQVEQNLWTVMSDGRLEEFNQHEQEKHTFLGDMKALWQRKL